MSPRIQAIAVGKCDTLMAVLHMSAFPFVRLGGQERLGLLQYRNNRE
jgi:hypothetical protein